MNFHALHDDALTCIFAQLPVEFRPVLREVCLYFRNIKILDVAIQYEKFFTFCVEKNYAKILEWYMPLNNESMEKLHTIIIDHDAVELLKQVGVNKVKNHLLNYALFTAKFRVLDYLCGICEMDETAWHHAICARDTRVLDYLDENGYKMPNNLSEYILTTYIVTCDTYLWVRKHYREN